MVLQPKFRRRNGGELPGPRTFVDRRELLAAFDSALERADGSGPKVLVFWGLAGIGKSRLRRELRERLAEREDGTLWCEVDFALPTLRDPQTALFSMRRQLSDRQGVHFPTFDLVYAYLWRLSRPNTAPVEEGRPLFEAGTMAASLVSSMGVPFVSLAAMIVEKASGPLKTWWIKRGREDLKTVSRLEPAEVEERLPAYFADDLSEYMEDNRLSGVVFLDTYEALFADVRSEEQRLTRDEWVRELVLQLPGFLFVICGRERLDWAELDPDWASVVGQHELAGLPESDARGLLAACYISDPVLQDRITKETGNVPFLLDLALDTMDEMRRRGQDIGPQDFTGWETNAEVRMAERFLRYLSPAEQDTVEVLAVPRVFDGQLFRDLCVAFNTQFPLGQFAEICRFSFMFERSPGLFQMHDVMAESLRARLRKRSPQRLKAIHSFLFERFDGKLEGIGARAVTPEQERALLDAYFHARHSLTLEEAIDWFIRRVAVFREAGRDRPSLNAARALVADARRDFGAQDLRTIRIMTCLGELNLPDSRESEAVLREALASARGLGSGAESLIHHILTRLARTLLFSRSQHEEPERLLRESLARQESRPVLDEVDYCLASASLSACLSESGRIAAARDVCRKALDTVGRDARNQFYFWVMNNLGYHLLELGYLMEAEREAWDCYGLVVETYAEGNYNVWCPLSTLCEIRLDQHRYAEAESYARRSLAAAELGEDARAVNDVLWLLAETLAESGRLKEARECADAGLQAAGSPRVRMQFLTTLAAVSLKEGALADSDRLLAEAALAAEGLFSQDHPLFAPIHVVHAGLAGQRGELGQAEAHLRTALKIVQTRLRPEHPKAGDILLRLANVRKEQGQLGEAAEFEVRGLEMRTREGCVG